MQVDLTKAQVETVVTVLNKSAFKGEHVETVVALKKVFTDAYTKDAALPALSVETPKTK